MIRNVVLTSSVLAAVLAVALGARWSFPIPGAAAPQSAQTLAVVVAGALLGPLWGPVAMLVYVLVGALGLPVFADGRAGLAVVTGPSAGYLLGFVVAAGVMGKTFGIARRLGSLAGPLKGAQLARSFATIFVLVLAAHGLILFLGGARLSMTLGVATAIRAGVVPFLWGGVVKSLVGAGIISVVVAMKPRSACAGIGGRAGGHRVQTTWFK